MIFWEVLLLKDDTVKLILLSKDNAVVILKLGENSYVVKGVSDLVGGGGIFDVCSVCFGI